MRSAGQVRGPLGASKKLEASAAPAEPKKKKGTAKAAESPVPRPSKDLEMKAKKIGEESRAPSEKGAARFGDRTPPRWSRPEGIVTLPREVTVRGEQVSQVFVHRGSKAFGVGEPFAGQRKKGHILVRVEIPVPPAPGKGDTAPRIPRGMPAEVFLFFKPRPRMGPIPMPEIGPPPDLPPHMKPVPMPEIGPPPDLPPHMKPVPMPEIGPPPEEPPRIRLGDIGDPLIRRWIEDIARGHKVPSHFFGDKYPARPRGVS